MQHINNIRFPYARARHTLRERFVPGEGKHTMPHIPLALSQPWLRIGQWGCHLRQLRELALLAFQVRNERRSLHGLDDRALEDLGFSRSDVDGESCRAFWDLPSDRTCT
jgi:uncharacterized protein YjiS (DUF1127 family)